MPSGEELTAFERYGVVLQKIEALSEKMDTLNGQWTRQLDHMEMEIGRKHSDHETRIRSIEGRNNLMVSIGVAVVLIAVALTWIIARGGP